MSLSQQKYREMVFQLLYSQDLGNTNAEAMQELMMAQLMVSKRNVRLAQERLKLITDHLNEIDQLIASVSKSYDFDRIQAVTKNILRVGVFELFFDDNIPPKVAIAEAIRLSRKFGTPESASFVNALLDNLYKSRNGGKADLSFLEKHSQQLLQSEEEEKQTASETQLSPDEDEK